MAVELNHTIVPARDPQASAQFLADILGLPVDPPVAHFTPVTLANGVSLDFDHHNHVDEHHYAFQLSDEEFQATFGRIKDRGITYYADPACRQPGQVYASKNGRARHLFPGPGRSPHGNPHPCERDGMSARAGDGAVDMTYCLRLRQASVRPGGDAQLWGTRQPGIPLGQALPGLSICRDLRHLPPCRGSLHVNGAAHRSRQLCRRRSCAFRTPWGPWGGGPYRRADLRGLRSSDDCLRRGGHERLAAGFPWLRLPGSCLPGGLGVASVVGRRARLSACRRDQDSSSAALDLGGA